MMSNETACSTPLTSKVVLLDQNNIPIEELLGSVTTVNNVEGLESKSQQLRTSARVFKKMRLDSAVSTSVPTTTDSKKEIIKEEIKPEVKKLSKPNWSQEDKSLFFEALNEFGKDFESIHCQITNKLRKRGLPESVMKTKDQIRHFYYRTWHKISKHLKFCDDIKKVVQELYGLINYGELRKKIGSVSEKTCTKLNELIYRGNVAVRLKGKTIRIKTPMCRALRKLNQLDEKHDDLKLPTRVGVELAPKNMEAWLKVQGVSQNPRVQASVPLQRRLITLLDYLNFKWKSIMEIAYENALNTHIQILQETKVSNTNENTKPTPQSQSFLRLSPHPKAAIDFPTINLSEYLTSQSICLNAFEERIGVKTPGEQLWIPKGGLKKPPSKRKHEAHLSEKSSPSQKILCLSAGTSAADNNETLFLSSEPIVLENDTFTFSQSKDVEIKEEDIKLDEVIKTEEVKEEIGAVEKKEQDVNLIRKGWTTQNCGALTIGELYLMFGSNSRLILEYSWDNPPTEESLKIETLITGATEIKENDCEIMSTTKDEPEMVTLTLQRLISIAKLQYRRNMVKCPCGHVCGHKSNNIIMEKAGSSSKSNKSVEQSEKIVSTSNDSSATTSVSSQVIQPNIQPAPMFRQPAPPNLEALRAQLTRLYPRYCNRRGRRPRSKQVVVERQLPLLPNVIDNKHQFVKMNIITSNTPRNIAPKILNVENTEHNIISTSSEDILRDSLTSLVKTETSYAKNYSTLELAGSSGIQSTSSNMIDISDNAITPSRVGSPTSISNLLDMALDVPHEMNEESGISSFMGLLSSSTPPTSPTSILKENDNQWLNSEVADFSLSSFLGHLESPVKAIQVSEGAVSEEGPQLSSDVDAQLHSLLMESSVDYMAKFADLAASVDQQK